MKKLNDLKQVPQVIGSEGVTDPELWVARFDSMDAIVPDCCQRQLVGVAASCARFLAGDIALAGLRLGRENPRMKRHTGRVWLSAAFAGMLGFSLPPAALDAAETGQGKRQLSWRKTPASLALLNGDRVVWQFNHLQDGKEKGCPYFHPLATMEGAVLTDLRPGDHLWHRGLRFAWKIINGLDGYWTWPEEQERSPDKALGHTDVTAVKVTANDDFSARIELEIGYHPPEAAADLTEKRVIEVGAPDVSGDYRIDWHGTFTAGARGAVLDRTPIPGEPDGKWFGGYAGLQFRLPNHDMFSVWTISNSEGISVASESDKITAETRKQLEPLHGKPARWVDLTLDMQDGRKGGATIMDHPGNLRHPPPWHIAAMPHEFHHAPLFNGPFTLKAGDPLSFRFRILVHAGPLQTPAVAGQWEDFVRKQ